MSNGHEPNKTPPPPPPPSGGEPKKTGGKLPDNTSTQPPQFRMAVVSGVGGFIGGFIGALLACHLCSRNNY